MKPIALQSNDLLCLYHIIYDYYNPIYINQQEQQDEDKKQPQQPAVTTVTTKEEEGKER